MPIVAAAAIGGVATIAGASMSSSAQGKAADQITQGNNAALAAQKAQQDNATKILTPYSTEGAAARGKYNALLGLGGHDATAATAGTPDWQAYLNNNTDLLAVSHQYADPIAYAQDHYARAGQAEGRVLPMTAGTPASAAVNGDDAQAAAMGDFRKSPFYTTTRDSAISGREALLGTASARAGTVSGRALRAVSDFTNENDQSALSKYMASLGGVADTGLTADSGIASAGQTFATAASNTAAQNGQAQANATVGSANAWNTALGDLGYTIGAAVGQIKPVVPDAPPSPSKPLTGTGVQPRQLATLGIF